MKPSDTTPRADDEWSKMGDHPPQAFDVWTRSNVAESWLNPVAPLTWSHIQLTFPQATRYPLRGLNKPYLEEIQWIKRLYGRVYYNEGAMAHILSHEYGLPTTLVGKAWGSHLSAKQHYSKFQFLRSLTFAPHLLTQLVDRLRAEREIEHLFIQIDHWTAYIHQSDIERLSDHALCTEFAQVWTKRFIRALGLHIIATSSAMTAFAALEGLIVNWCGQRDVSLSLVTGLPDIDTADIGAWLWRIAQQARALGLVDLILTHTSERVLEALQTLPRAQPWLDQIAAFLDSHGHHCPNEEEWLYPRWREDPAQIVAIIADYLRQDEIQNPSKLRIMQTHQREAAVDQVEAQLGYVRRLIFRYLLARVQYAVQLRDNSKHYLMKLAFPICAAYRLIGRRWAARGWLQSAEDVFFLTIPEIEAICAEDRAALHIADLVPLISERRQAYQHWFTVQAPAIIDRDGRPQKSEQIISAVTSDHIQLQGLPASGGIAHGPARILNSASEMNQLQPGDILVTHVVDPGWTVVFPIISGMVVEIGGQLSHGMVVAREYGVPAVVAIPDATRRIREGQTVTVNGTTGRVEIS